MNAASDPHDQHDEDGTVPSANAETAPAPTIAPIALAFGIMLIPWGILTHGLVSLAGLCLITWSITKWVNEIRKEWSADDRASASGSPSTSL